VFRYWELTKSRLPAAARARFPRWPVAVRLALLGHQLPVDDRVRVAAAFEARAADRRVDGVRGRLLGVIVADASRLAVRASVARLPPSLARGPVHAPELGRLLRRVARWVRRDDGGAVAPTERSSSSTAEKLVVLRRMPNAAEDAEATERSSSSSGAATGGARLATGRGGGIKGGGGGGGGPRPTSSGKNTARCSGSSIGSGSMLNREKCSARAQ
jgi:uncharacterized membrane protein YgcG